jgi:DNA-binding NarL/FixJ family response regulator
MHSKQHITVLFIDGCQEDRRAWAEGFHMSSPESVVLQADSGAAGLAMCRAQRVDCVVVELSLPDMSGFQVLLNLVPSGHKATVAVILLTRLPLVLMAELAKTIGAKAFLVKSDTSSHQLKVAVRHAVATLTASTPEPPVERHHVESGAMRDV